MQFLDSGDMPVVVTTGHVVQTCRKLWFSSVAVLDKVADVPARAVHRPGVDVPVLCSDAVSHWEVPQIQLIA